MCSIAPLDHQVLFIKYVPKMHTHTYFKLYFTYTDSNSSTSNYGSTSSQCLVLIKLVTGVIVCYKYKILTEGYLL